MNKILQFIKSPWGSALVGVVLFFATLGYFVVNTLPAKKEPVEKVKAITIGPSWTYHNPEIELYVQELRDQKSELDAWEAELEQLELRLKAEREELRQNADEVRALQDAFNQGLVRMSEAEVANLKKLAQLYIAMKPENALKILEQFTDEELVKMLLVFPEKTAASLLESLASGSVDKAVRAHRISEYIRVSIQTEEDADT